MAIFTFDTSYLLGRVRAVDTRRIDVQANSDEDLRKARVGQFVSIALPGAIEEWLIGVIDRVVKTPIIEEPSQPGFEGDEEMADVFQREGVLNTVRIILVGTVGMTPDNKHRFSRSLVQVPEIDGKCHILRDAQLQTFMALLSAEGKTEHSLEIGRYTIDENAVAYLDGNKFFQRHASLVGSTGSGKSWAVATILEQAANLPSSNLIVFDLHGEYSALSYARHLRIPGPEELGQPNDSLLFLPYWLLNAEELQAMFIDRSEFSAHNQVTVFQDTVVSKKRERLSELGKEEVLAAFTLDSPVPFSIDDTIAELRHKNEEMVAGARGGTKQGLFHGQFSRLLVRLDSRVSDKRYGFLFQAPLAEHEYDAMAAMMKRLMDYSEAKAQITVIDFSEVPADIMPVIVGLVARIIYQVQFWTDRERRKPIALVCDEAHMYLPNKDGKNPVEQRAVESFEKIAKEGRKYGVALLVVSQRPADVSPTILSQCNNLMSLRLTNGEDQATVRRLMPESLEGLMDTLPILDIGEALVVGDAVLLPSRIRFHPPKEKPLSATIDFWDEWSKEADTPDFVKAVENMRRQNRS